MSDLRTAKLMFVNCELLEISLREIEERYDVSILPSQAEIDAEANEAFYPQFPKAVRLAAKEMAKHYEIFYCLEVWIRDLVSVQLRETYGDDWWETSTSDTVQSNAEKNIARERDAAVSARSTDPIDYTTFGELSNIVEYKWDDFSDTFNSKRGLVSVLARLNVLRGPIAHCSALSPDEVLRLQITIADFFRLME